MRAHQRRQVVIAAPVDAEVVLAIAIAVDAAGQRAEQRIERAQRAPRDPGHQRQQHQRGQQPGQARVLQPVMQQQRQGNGRHQHRQAPAQQPAGQRPPHHWRRLMAA